MPLPEKLQFYIPRKFGKILNLKLNSDEADHILGEPLPHENRGTVYVPDTEDTRLSLQNAGFSEEKVS